ncbi:transcription factor E2F6 isoform X2 [Sander vitreus]
MVFQCAFRKCKNKSNRWEPQSFHKFPLRDPERNRLWLLAAGLDIKTPAETLLKWRMCSDHFRPGDFKKKRNLKEHKSLTTNAVPSVFPDAPTATDEQVWLAALRETNKQDSTEQHLICEDHFLPEDISNNGVNSDAIPIMPPYLDGPMGLISPWGAESSEEEDQWTIGGGCNDDDDDEADEGDGAPAHVEPPAPEPPVVDPPQQDLGANKTSGAKTTGVSPHQKKERIQTKRVTRQDVSLGMLTQRFLELLLAAPGGSLDLRQVTTSLQTRRRRVYDITNVLEGINLIEKQSANKVKWIGSCHISSFLWMSQQRVQRELDNLKLVEDTLDTFIKSCAQQLFDMTDDLENAASAYVTHEDVRRLAASRSRRCSSSKLRRKPSWRFLRPKRTTSRSI